LKSFFFSLFNGMKKMLLAGVWGQDGHRPVLRRLLGLFLFPLLLWLPIPSILLKSSLCETGLPSFL
jgi:hypothetical protein